MMLLVVRRTLILWNLCVNEVDMKNLFYELLFFLLLDFVFTAFAFILYRVFGCSYLLVLLFAFLGLIDSLMIFGVLLYNLFRNK